MNEKFFRCSSMEGRSVKQTIQGANSIQEKNLLTYLFEFGIDEMVYSISFQGKIPPAKVTKMLESTRNCLYEEMAKNIQSYLEQYHMDYSNFVAMETLLEHEKIMDLSNSLLHSATYSKVNEQIGEADVYYGIMDHLQRIHNNHCVGCYYIVKRTLSEQNGLHQYKIIGQAFTYNDSNNKEQSYFAIRANNGSRYLHNIDVIRGNPVIPTFGCVDMMGLLLDIDNIKTAMQVEKIARK